MLEYWIKKRETDVCFFCNILDFNLHFTRSSACRKHGMSLCEMIFKSNRVHVSDCVVLSIHLNIKKNFLAKTEFLFTNHSKNYG